MRLTLDLDDEVYSALERLAHTEHSSASAIASRLMQHLLPGTATKSQSLTSDYDIPVSRGRMPFTSSDVAAAEDDNDLGNELP